MEKLSGILFFATLASFTAFIGVTYGFGVYLFPALAPEMMKDIEFTYRDMGFATGLAQVGFLCCALLSGLLTKRYGGFTIIRISLLTCLFSLAGIAMTDSFLVISLMLVLLGGSAAAVWTPMAELSQRFFASRHQGKSLGLMSSGTAYGVFVNSLVITIVFQTYGWRAIWLISCGLVLLLCAGAFILLSKLERLKQPQTSQATTQTVTKTTVFMHIKSLPIAKTSVILILMLLNGFACIPFQTYLSSFLVDEHMFSLQNSAEAWRLIGLIGMVSGFGMGALGDWITIRWSLLITYGALALATAMLLLDQVDIFHLYVIASAFGLAFYAIFGLLPAYISHNYEGNKASIVFGFGNITLGLGGIIGNATGGLIKQETGSFSGLYSLILIVTYLSIVLCFWLRPEKSIRKVN